ncbi:hypothetical protein SUGI_0483830 [Cryptomeria japonica]|nr:hypothetical protein SUGI_0483830 [Cryptomeria japonica]
MLWYKSLNAYFNPPLYQLDVPEFKDNSGVSSNDLYEIVQQYLASLEGIAPRQTAFRAKNSCNMCFSPVNDEEVEDFFQEVRPRWKDTAKSVQNGSHYERRSFTLILPKVDKRFLSAYVNHITRRGENFSRVNKELTLYSIQRKLSMGTDGPAFHSSIPPLQKQDREKWRGYKEIYIEERGGKGRGVSVQE